MGQARFDNCIVASQILDASFLGQDFSVDECTLGKFFSHHSTVKKIKVPKFHFRALYQSISKLNLLHQFMEEICIGLPRMHHRVWQVIAGLFLQGSHGQYIIRLDPKK